MYLPLAAATYSDMFLATPTSSIVCVSRPVIGVANVVMSQTNTLQQVGAACDTLHFSYVLKV